MIFGIMGAMPDEVDQLCARLQDVTCETYAGVDYHKGTLQGKQVVVCCAGMGKANAASTVQVLCTRYGIDRLIFSGIAGNMTSKIGIGDVCVGETVVYHDAELDMLAQSAPFLKEYHGDPALVAAALDACAACGVEPVLCWQERLEEFAELAAKRHDALLILGKYSMQTFLDSIPPGSGYHPDLVGVYNEWTWAQAASARLQGTLVEQAECMVRTAVQTLIAQIEDHEVRHISLPAQFLPKEAFSSFRVRDLTSHYLDSSAP